jgi:quercetin dioxygenase-like cupin family protein
MDKKDPMIVANNVYKFLMENDRVRVLQVTFKPGAIAKMHYHPDHIIYALKGGTLKLTSEGKPSDVKLEAGQVMFLNAQNHEAENTGKTTVDLVVVELKK